MAQRAAGVVTLVCGVGLVALLLYGVLLDREPGWRPGVLALVLFLVFCRSAFTWFVGRIPRG